ncbi:hypothetical protein [Cohnella terricola]|uniref:Integrase catalytic domain-containing protein n=1 Tax=Cohnella terricola TaxID=1289167 RepID=A0A559JQN4_9BACL|nr:hypothetical protein [Cohnella terricola]TVY02167.1 hypothetical protein FPZ45_06915 [Cohnella terricola]
MWDVICFDNAMSHTANMVKDRLSNLLHCSLNFGPVDMPMRRSLIERFFQSLEESGFHRLPNTTGSGPKDPRRNEPEQRAINYQITYEHLLELVDVLISNYNGTPHGGIYNQRPLELLQKRMEKGMTPRKLDKIKQSEMLFMQTAMKRTIRGSIASGKRPYIQYEGVEYRNERLANSAHLIGTEVTLHVNVDDIRVIKAFLPDGSELGYLSAAGKWSLTSHTLQIRQAINKLVTRRLLHFTYWDDPIFIYTEFLLSQAKIGKKRDVNKVKNVQEVARKKTNKKEQDTDPELMVRNEALERARTQVKVAKDIKSDDYDEILKDLKTITY